MKYQRPLLKTIIERLKESRKFVQVICGPRQVGKTTLALALRDRTKGLVDYHSADDTSDNGAAWIDQIWEAMRVRMSLAKSESGILIIDEVQKIHDWSAVVKKNWDRDTREKRIIKLILLGSSRLLLMDGLSESLTGRFELHYAGHWSFAEMKKAFGFSAEQYQWFGGYPGAADLISDESRFKEYVRNAIVEPTLVRDILMTTKIDKPALLRQLFEVGTGYSAQIMSFNRMLGQLQDAGNTTTLAKYLNLLGQAGMISGLNKYSGRLIKTKGSIPKFQTHNSALISAMRRDSFEDAIIDSIGWGSIVENSVGTHLIDQMTKAPNAALCYWREKDMEVDYVVVLGKKVLGIEVKSGSEGISAKAATNFTTLFPNAKLLLVGKNGIPYEEFMETELSELFNA